MQSNIWGNGSGLFSIAEISKHACKLESVEEPFDEVPELMLKCLHYVLIIGIKNMELNLDDFWTKSEHTKTDIKHPVYETPLEIQPSSELQQSQLFQR